MGTRGRQWDVIMRSVHGSRKGTSERYKSSTGSNCWNFQVSVPGILSVASKNDRGQYVVALRANRVENRTLGAGYIYDPAAERR